MIKLIHRRIKHLIEERTIDNPIRAADISRLLRIEDDYYNRRTRALIRETIRLLKVPIVSNTHGHWIAANKKELDDCLESLEQQMTAIKGRMRLMRRAYKKYYKE